jgi:hypothetical protein
LPQPILKLRLVQAQGPHEIVATLERSEVFIEGVLRYAADHECNWSYITAPESLALR